MSKKIFEGWTWSEDSIKKACIVGAVVFLMLLYNIYSNYGVYLSCCQAKCDHVTFGMTVAGNTLTGGIYGMWEYLIRRGSECDASTHANRMVTDANYFKWRQERKARKEVLSNLRSQEAGTSVAQPPWGGSA